MIADGHFVRVSAIVPPENRTVSLIGKNLFNIQDRPVSKTNELDNLPTKDLFEFLSNEHSSNSDLGLFSLLPDIQGEDYEEEKFANQMKKNKIKERRKL